MNSEDLETIPEVLEPEAALTPFNLASETDEATAISSVLSPPEDFQEGVMSFTLEDESNPVEVEPQVTEVQSSQATEVVLEVSELMEVPREEVIEEEVPREEVIEEEVIEEETIENEAQATASETQLWESEDQEIGEEISPEIPALMGLPMYGVNPEKSTIEPQIRETEKIMVQEMSSPMELLNGERRATESIRILHLSGLHMQIDTDPLTMLQPLVADLRGGDNDLNFAHLDYLVVSGDLTRNALPEEFEKAQILLSELLQTFKLTPDRCIVTPGKHDLDRNQSVYGWKPKRLVDTTKLKPGTYVEQERVVLIRNEDEYASRFNNFSKGFYNTFLQQTYPLVFEEQCIPFLFEESRIQFLAMNSCWEIDELFPNRASIHTGALARGLTKADEQIERAVQEGRITKDTSILRIAVCYHPLLGEDKIINDSFLARLRQAGFQLCIHGDIDEEREELVGYLHPTWRINIAGTGSFGTPVSSGSESGLRLYSILEVAQNHSKMRVHTRYLRRARGSWEGWPVWPGQTRNERRTYYEIDIQE